MSVAHFSNMPYRRIYPRKSSQSNGGFDHFDRLLQTIDKKKLPDYIHHNDSFIKPHSTALWNILIKSHRTISDIFVVKLFSRSMIAEH